ncbi:MAG: hypothetical protein A2Y25_08810 [Candidatus Melainabacteria bacterium GWF2_37_15]|nr:MAG: hypothetical protein A2Y25_08810 [Candidatus Melainabacteria bacterium GWF2_37_15]
MQRETLLRTIIENIRSSLDVNETKKNIVTQIGQAFNADRCFIALLDVQQDKFVTPDKYAEYLSSPELSSVVGIKPDEEIHEPIIKLAKEKKDNIIYDFEKKIIENPAEKEFLEGLKRYYNVKSDYGVNICYGGVYLGAIVLHYMKAPRYLNDDDIKFLKTIADQIGISLHHAQLYEDLKQKAEREVFLRKITELISSSLDIDEIENQIVTNVGRLLKADRVFIINFDKSKGGYFPVEKEYLSSKQIKSMKGHEPEKEVPELIKVLMSDCDLSINNVEEYIKNNNLQGSLLEKHFNFYDIKSGFCISMVNGEKRIGRLVVQSCEKINFFTEGDIEFAKIIANQAAMAMSQAELYETLKQTAERERLLRDLIQTIRSSFDINETKKLLVDKIGKSLNADRVFFVEYNPETNTPHVLDKYSEYLSSPDLVSYVGFNFSGPKVEFLAKEHKQKKLILATDIDEFIKENNLQNTPTEKWLREAQLKTGVGITIFYGEKIYGVLSIHFTKAKVHLSEERVQFLKTLGDQVGIAFYQAKLFEKQKQIADRERILRDFIATIRSTLDKNEIKQRLITLVGQSINADRVYIAEYDKKTGHFPPVMEEYLSSPDIKSTLGFLPERDSPEGMDKAVTQIIIIEDTEAWLKKHNIENSKTAGYLREHNVKSGFSVPLSYAGEFLGTILIHYTGGPRAFITEDVKFVETLTDQTSIGLYQSQLFETIQKTAERERLLRNLTATIRSSLDINEVLSVICEQIAKVFEVDRITIVEFPNNKNYQDFILRKEYKKTEKIKGIYDYSKSELIAEFWGKKLLDEGDILAFYNIAESDAPELIKNFYEKLEVKSMIGVPIRHESEKWGMLVLSELNKFRNWNSEEIILLKSISDQIFIAIKHAELLESIKQTAEREKFLAEVISIVKSTLDMDEILALISGKIEKFLGVKKVLINVTSAKKIKMILDPPKILKNEEINLLERIFDNISIAIRDSDIYTKSRFIADVSHELRTPVAIIDGYANNLINRQDYSPETVDKYLNIIKKNTIRMSNIIENLMTLSQLQKGEEDYIIAFEEVNAENLIKNVVQIQETLIKDKKITFETQCNGQITVKANEILLEQALLNLVKNAVQYSSDKSKIIIKAKKTGNNVVISVQDFGCGIEKSHLKNIFKRFYRVDKSRSRETGGSGLGLSIVENIVKTHNGKVSVKSQVNRGSLFTIEIPCF